MMGRYRRIKTSSIIIENQYVMIKSISQKVVYLLVYHFIPPATVLTPQGQGVWITAVSPTLDTVMNKPISTLYVFKKPFFMNTI